MNIINEQLTYPNQIYHCYACL